MKVSTSVPGQVIHDEVLNGRHASRAPIKSLNAGLLLWHKRLSRGSVLRIVDLEGC
jgi:hypothetical protein